MKYFKITCCARKNGVCQVDRIYMGKGTGGCLCQSFFMDVNTELNSFFCIKILLYFQKSVSIRGVDL